MPNQLTTAGLQVKSISDILSDITTALQTIYGPNINVAQNTPDGQLMNIFAQATADQLELLVAVYNSFAVPTAAGVLLDQRVALNGLARNAGTYTITNVTVTVNQALTLTGLDALVANPSAAVFTVADNAGNQFQLVTTKVFSGAGSSALVFQSAVIGAVQTLPNTITNQITVVVGVTSVNNPTSATSTGVNEETDAQLKVRHAQSFFLPAICPVDSLEAALLATAGILDALVLENVTNSTDANGIPAHSIWVMVLGATDATVGGVIYAKKAPGCGMKGSYSTVIARPNGQNFTAIFDRWRSQNIWYKFSLIPKTAGVTFDNTAIKNALVAALSYKMNQAASIADIINNLLIIQPDAIVTATGVSSDGVSYFDIIYPTAPNYAFLPDTSRIVIS